MLVKAHLTYQDMDLRLYNSQNISAPFLRIDDAYFLSSPMKEVSFLQSFQALKRHRLGMSNNFGIKFFTPDLHFKKILIPPGSKMLIISIYSMFSDTFRHSYLLLLLRMCLHWKSTVL